LGLGLIRRHSGKRFQLFNLLAVHFFQIFRSLFVGLQTPLEDLLQTLGFLLCSTNLLLLAVKIILGIA
jgi:hypothetical protein